ncbi:MAG: YfhO family protein, partial [Clostridia bacterium]|nr:YfhO family protein [Clostridia bacterium]
MTQNDMLPELNKKSVLPQYRLLSFMIPSLMLALMYVAMLIYPFGNGTVLVLDLNGQYVYFFEALRDAIWGEGSIFYSFERTLSGEFLGIFAYYLASPLSFLVALFPKSAMQEAIFTILVLKCGLCGLTAHHYITKTRDINSIGALIFSSCYALSAYGVVYASNTMWIDCMYLLPLIMLGIEKLITERKYLLYTLSLAAALISSYYIGYMICIFAVIYFFAFYFGRTREERGSLTEKVHFVKSGLRFTHFSLMSAALASPILLPAVYSLSFGKNDFSSPKYAFVEKTDFIDIFLKMLPASYDTVRPDGMPFIYCSMLCLVLGVLYFLVPGIKTRRRVSYGALLALFALSFCGSTIDLVWHGFQFPNWLNFRYSFIFIFLITLIAADAFVHIKDIPGERITAVVIAVMIICALFQKQDYEYINMMACVWAGIGTAVLCLIGLRVYRSGYRGGAIVLLCLTLVELYGNGVASEYMMHDDVGFSKHSSYSNFMEKYRPAADYMSEYDKGLYRSENYVIRKVNDNYAVGLNGISGSTSTLNKNVIDFLSDMGYCSRSHHSNYSGGTPVGDSLLGIKYLLSSADKPADPAYTTVWTDTENEVVLYENPYALPLAYTVASDFETFDTSASPSPFELVNRMCAEMTGGVRAELFKSNRFDMKLENVVRASSSNTKKYKRNKDTGARINFVITAESDGVMYAYFPVTNGYRRDITVKYGETEIENYFTGNYHGIMCLGEFKRGDIAYLTVTLDEEEVYFDSANYFYTL